MQLVRATSPPLEGVRRRDARVTFRRKSDAWSERQLVRRLSTELFYEREQHHSPLLQRGAERSMDRSVSPLSPAHEAPHVRWLVALEKSLKTSSHADTQTVRKLNDAVSALDIERLSVSETEQRANVLIEHERIRKAVSSLKVFKGLAPAVVGKTALAFNKVQLPPDEIFLRQGQDGEFFWVVLTGEVEVSKSGKILTVLQVRLAIVFATACFLLPSNASLFAHHVPLLSLSLSLSLSRSLLFQTPVSLGEISLLANIPITVNVKTIGACDALRLSKADFKRLLAPLAEVWNNRAQLMLNESINAIALFQSLTQIERDQLCKSMHIICFNAGSKVVEQGMRGDVMFILLEGSVEVLVHNPELNVTELAATLKQGNYFGEMALVDKSCLRLATCVAKSTIVKCAVLQRAVVFHHPSFARLIQDFSMVHKESLRDTMLHRAAEDEAEEAAELLAPPSAAAAEVEAESNAAADPKSEDANIRMNSSAPPERRRGGTRRRCVQPVYFLCVCLCFYI